MFYSTCRIERQLSEKKSGTSHWQRNFHPMYTALSRNAIMIQQLIISFSLLTIICHVVTTFTSKIGCGRLREVAIHVSLSNLCQMVLENSPKLLALVHVALQTCTVQYSKLIVLIRTWITLKHSKCSWALWLIHEVVPFSDSMRLNALFILATSTCMGKTTDMSMLRDRITYSTDFKSVQLKIN